MFDGFRGASLAAKMAVLCTVGILLGLGLCGLGAARTSNFLETQSNLVSAGAAFFWLSLLGLVIALASNRKN